MNDESHKPVLADAQVAKTVAAVLRIVRDQQPLSAVVSKRMARLIQEVLRSSGDHDTALRVAEAKFANWAKETRRELRRLPRGPRSSRRWSCENR